MAEIRHRVGVNAPVAQVYRAIATPDGVREWWTRDVSGDGQVGSELVFGFPSPDRGATMEVVELVPDRTVVWHVVKGPDEWVGTTITFDLSETDDETAVMFTHAGWREPVGFMHHCSTKWAYFLLSMKHAVEGGAATPWPDDELISSWG
jgi:uncharacterized protein YndB with AHSA1/START domain